MGYYSLSLVILMMMKIMMMTIMMTMMMIMMMTMMMIMMMMLGRNCDPSFAALPSPGGPTGTDRGAPGPHSTPSRSHHCLLTLY